MSTDRPRDLLMAAFDDELTEEIVDVTCQLVDIPSPTGEEGPIGEHLAELLGRVGLDVTRQEVEPGRCNVIGLRRGSGGGRSLMFNGHLDTSTTGEEPGLPFGLRPEARRVDGWIYGLGVSNMKAALAAYYGAALALNRAGVTLAGDLIICGVVGEIEKAPVGRYTGPRFRGGGVGTMYAAHHGVLADGCIIGEPTGLRLQTGNTSYAFARIETKGLAQHTWSKERGIDAIERGFRLFQALRAWEPAFEAAHPHPRMGSRLAVSAVEGGFPFKPSIAPAPSCAIYVDLRFPPTTSVVDVRNQLISFVRRLTDDDPDLEASVEIYLCRPGYELASSDPIVGTVREAHRDVVGTDPGEPDRYRYAVSADASILHDYGVSAITYGPGGIDRAGDHRMYDEHGELCAVENIVTCAKVYALAAVSYCGVADRP